MGFDAGEQWTLHTTGNETKTPIQSLSWVSSTRRFGGLIIADPLWETKLTLYQITSELATSFMNGCDPRLLGIEKPTRFAQCYCYVRELPDTAELCRYRWDEDSRLLRCVGLSRLIHPTTVGFRHLRDFNASRNAGLMAAVSDLALIILAAADGSFALEGMRPQRISDNSRMGSFGFCRMTGTG